MLLSSIRSGGGEQNSSSKKTGLRPAVEKKQMMMMKKTAVGCERDETVGSRTKQLEVDLRRVKDSEMKMLESLMSQTKQLAETKIELEEAKLEIGVLRDTIRSSRNVPKAKPSESESEFSHQEIERLKNELKLAVGAEEKSKKAMDDLAAALKEVAWEANQAKEKLLVAETQLLDKRSEVESSKAGLRLAEEELARTKMEAEESAVRWNAEQEGLKTCMRLLEEEIKAGKEDNTKLIEAEKGWRNEVSNMKDIMKHALKEATMAKEALEISRNDDKISTTNPESDGDRRLKTNGDIRSESVRYPPTYSQRTTRKDTGFGSTRFGSFEFSSGQTSRHNINIQSTTNLNSPADNSNSKADLKKKHMFRKFADILRRRGK